MSNHAQIGRTVVDDPPTRKNENPSECGECGKPMRDDNERGCSEIAPNVLENKRFRTRIKTGGCLVEDQNPRLLQEGSCNGKPLTLATGKLAGSGPDSLPETIGQRRNKR